MKKKWTNHELDYLYENYPHQYSYEIKKVLKRSINSINSKAYVLKLKKTIAFKRKEAQRLKTTGKFYQFQKGYVSPNKGKKLTEFMSPEGIEASKKTRYQKGNQPHNIKANDGVIVDRVDSDGRNYRYIRLSKAKWVPLHRHLWEQAYGPIPENHIIIFKDNNTENAVLENLKCMSKAENMLRNSKYNYPEQIIPSMVLINKLETLLKQKQDGKQ